VTLYTYNAKVEEVRIINKGYSALLICVATFVTPKSARTVKCVSIAVTVCGL